MAAKELWVDKYNPTTLDGFVFKDEHQKEQINKWVYEDKSIPHLLFSGSAGVGKTTLAHVLINLIGVNSLDLLEINASRTNSVDDVRDKITNFIQMIPFGEFKVVLLDEADYLSLSAQAALRGLIVDYQAYARFIFTCNYPNRIIPAIHSRCQSIHVDKVDINEFTARVANILLSENVQFDLDTLDTFVNASYPDLRKCINNCELNSLHGELTVQAIDTTGGDYKIEMVDLFKSGKITDARKLICSQARPEEMEEIYRWLYNNLELLGDTDEKQDNAILIIKQGLVDHTLVIDPEINLAAVLIRLARNHEA